MTQEKIDRINQLARKAKTADGLSPDEVSERSALRLEYVLSIRNNLTAQLDNTYFLNEDGTKTKLQKKSDPSQEQN